MNIFFLDTDIVVSPSNVKFGEDSCILYSCDKFRDKW
jgi:hypothetical protein